MTMLLLHAPKCNIIIVILLGFDRVRDMFYILHDPAGLTVGNAIIVDLNNNL